MGIGYVSSPPVPTRPHLTAPGSCQAKHHLASTFTLRSDVGCPSRSIHDVRPRDFTKHRSTACPPARKDLKHTGFHLPMIRRHEDMFCTATLGPVFLPRTAPVWMATPSHTICCHYLTPHSDVAGLKYNIQPCWFRGSNRCQLSSMSSGRKFPLSIPYYSQRLWLATPGFLEFDHLYCLKDFGRFIQPDPTALESISTRYFGVDLPPQHFQDARMLTTCNYPRDRPPKSVVSTATAILHRLGSWADKGASLALEEIIFVFDTDGS